jgi:monofunctional biosynthetic peptidoglycan transglycosylase
MEVYLNVAETGIGTYGVNAGSQRYYGHDASAMTRTEAARLAAVLPLPKGREAIAPRGFTKRYGNSIAGRIAVVARDGLDSCVYAGNVAPRDRAPPPSRKPITLPGSDVETSTPPPPPPREVLDQLPPAPEQLQDPPAELTAVEPEVPEEAAPIKPDPAANEF